MFTSLDLEESKKRQESKPICGPGTDWYRGLFYGVCFDTSAIDAGGSGGYNFPKKQTESGC